MTAANRTEEVPYSRWSCLCVNRQELPRGRVSVMNSSSPLILIIEDDAQTRRFLKAGLEARMACPDAESGSQGLLAAKADNPDLVILDLGLPDLDGVSLVRSLRLLADMPILILSARSREQDRSRHWMPVRRLSYQAFQYRRTGCKTEGIVAKSGKTASRGDVFELGMLRIDLVGARGSRTMSRFDSPH